MIYFISDSHFEHENVIKYSNRPFKDIYEMREQMIQRWNSVVQPDDIVYHLGDFILGSKEQAKDILDRLNGNKILIKGNHDNHSDHWYIDAGFLEVHNSLLLNYNNQSILLTHYPYRIPEQYKSKYNIHLYGHMHEKGDELSVYPTFAQNGACLSVERIDYTPLSIDKVIESCKNTVGYFDETIPSFNKLMH